jgi:hypothetical protein
MRRRVLKNWMSIHRTSQTDGRVHEHLMGEVYGDPSRPDGTMITTSPVIEHEPGAAITASGTRYELDGPSVELDDEQHRRRTA